MNNTISLSALINRLAKVANTDTNTSRRFLRTFFAAIEDQLSAGESVSIKGIGTFRRSQDPTFGNPGALQFIPDEQLAAETNAPFAMFSAVELADGVSFKDIDEATEEHSGPEPTAEPEPVSAPEPAPAEPEEEPEEPKPMPEPAPEPKPINISAPKRQEAARAPLRWPEEEEEDEKEEVIIPASDNGNNDSDDSIVETAAKEHRRLPWWFWLGTGLLLVGGGVAGYFAAMYEPSEFESEDYLEAPADSLENISVIEEIQVSEIETSDSPANAQAESSADITPAAPAATAAPEPAKPEPEARKTTEPVYDTVDVSLAKLAKKHYGNTNYWVFIYKANEAELGNPDHIRRGTRVLIPAKESFQEATDSETKAKAAKIAAEISRKFRK